MTLIEAEEMLARVKRLQEEINSLQAKQDELINYYSQKIEKARAIFEKESEGAWLEIRACKEELRLYAQENLRGKKRSISLPSGSLHLRKRPPKLLLEGETILAYSEEMLAFAKEKAPEFVKVRTDEYVDWAALKKTLRIDGDKVYSQEGELLEQIQVQIFPDEFTVNVY